MFSGSEIKKFLVSNGQVAHIVDQKVSVRKTSSVFQSYNKSFKYLFEFNPIKKESR